MALTHREIFERYVYAGAITRNPDAIAAMFTEDGVYDAPLVPDGHPLHRRLVGRDAIRTGTSVYHQQPTYQGTVNLERSAYVLHDTCRCTSRHPAGRTVGDGPSSRKLTGPVMDWRLR